MDKRLTRCAVAQRSHMAASPTGFVERGWLWSEPYVQQGAHCHRRHVVGRDEEHFPTAWIEVARRLAARHHHMADSSRDHRCFAIYCRGMFQDATPYIELHKEIVIHNNIFSRIIGAKKAERCPTLGSGLSPAGAIPRLAPCSQPHAKAPTVFCIYAATRKGPQWRSYHITSLTQEMAPIRSFSGIIHHDQGARHFYVLLVRHLTDMHAQIHVQAVRCTNRS
jgi:hypothetical protein